MAIFGISTSAAPIRDYWKSWLGEIDFKALEINLFKSTVPFSQQTLLEDVKPTLRRFDLSFHSRSNPLFGVNKMINVANQYTLLAEIEIANLVQAKELVFHLPKIDDIVSIRNQIIDFLPKVIEFAESKKVKMLFENDSEGAFSKPENLLFIFDKFPELKLALDIGHVFRAQKNEGVVINDFMNELGHYAVYAHVHDGDKGNKHGALIDNPSRKDFYKDLRKSNIRKYIMESHSYEDCVKSKELIKKYGIHESKQG